MTRSTSQHFRGVVRRIVNVCFGFCYIRDDAVLSFLIGLTSLLVSSTALDVLVAVEAARGQRKLCEQDSAIYTVPLSVLIIPEHREGFCKCNGLTLPIRVGGLKQRSRQTKVA